MERADESMVGRERDGNGRFQQGRPRTDPACPGTKSHQTADAYHNHKCRCPEAVAAFRARPRRQQGRSAVQLPPAINPDGTCAAEKHHSYVAWLAGCRCPHSVRRREEVQASVYARTTGRLQPWLKWRGTNMRVSRVNLLLLLSGFSDQPTYAERMVACLILSQRGSATAGPLGRQEIADRLHTTVERVASYLGKIEVLAGERTRRRLADVKWKAARVARANERRSHA